jgi:transposase
VNRRKRPSDRVLRTLYQDRKLTITAIARRYGVVPSTAWAWLKDRGIELRPTGRTSGPTRRDINESMLRQLYEIQRLSIYAIGRKVGAAPATVWKWLVHFGIPIYPRGSMKSKAPPEATLRDLREVQRLSQRAIATRFGVSHQSVSNWCQRYGINQATPSAYS